MADNVRVNDGTGSPIATDDVGGAHYQKIKVDLGADGATSPLVRGAQTAANSLPVTIATNDPTVALLTTIDGDTGTLAGAVAGSEVQVDVVGALPAGTNNIGDVDVLTVPADPFGANADAASATGSISAKLRFIAATGIPITGTVAVTQSGTWDEVGINDSGNSITVDYATTGSGTATGALRVELPTNGTGVVGLNAGTNAIGKLAANSGVDIGDVDVTSVPTDPFGANADAASATGSISAKLKGIATALGVTALDLGSGTGGTRTLRSFQDTAQWVGGTGTDTSATQRVSLATNVALPAGTNAIGKLAANSGVDIGDVDVTSIIPGTGATNLGKAEDAAHASADVGVQMLAVRKATPATLSDTDGDYEPAQISIGHIWVAPPVTTKVSVNFNRPADTTAYAANDAVNDNTTAGSVTELSWAIGRSAGTLRRVRIKKTDQTVATPTIRLWLYDTVFASAAGDNAALTHPATDSIGYVDVLVTTAGTDDAVGWADCDIPFTGATLYGQLQTLSAFTPANAETFTVDLWYRPG